MLYNIFFAASEKQNSTYNNFNLQKTGKLLKVLRSSATKIIRKGKKISSKALFINYSQKRAQLKKKYTYSTLKHKIHIQTRNSKHFYRIQRNLKKILIRINTTKQVFKNVFSILQKEVKSNNKNHNYNNAALNSTIIVKYEEK